MMTRPPMVFRDPVIGGGSYTPPDAHTFIALYGDSAIANLPRNLDINGTRGTLVLAYEGRSAGASTWTAEAGPLLTLSGSGSDPTTGRATPLTLDTDKSVLFNTGKTYDALSDTVTGDIGTDDFVFEAVYRQPVGGSLAGRYRKRSGTGSGFLGLPGWNWRTEPGGQSIFSFAGGATVLTLTMSTVVGTWNHNIWFCDRDEASTNGMIGYMNGVLSAQINPSTSAGAITAVGQPVIMGQESSSEIAWFAMWKAPAWFAGGATNATQWAAVAKERHARVTGMYPQRALGASTPLSMTRTTNGYLDRLVGDPDDGIRQLFFVAGHWIRLCHRPENAGGSARKGALIEQQRTNVMLQSQTFDNATWTKLASAVTANTTVALDNTTTADALVADATLAQHGVSQVVTLVSATYTLSVWAKQGNQSFIILEDATIANGRVWFDIATGLVGTKEAGIVEALIIPYGNGWFRCSGSFVAAAAAHTLRISAASADNVATFTGDAATTSTTLWGAQLEVNETASSYIPTTTASVTRGLDTLQYTMNDGNFTANTQGTFSASTLHGTNRNITATAMIANISAAQNSVVDSIRIESTAADLPRTVGNVASVAQFDITGTTDVADGEIHDLRTSYEANDARLFVDGAQEGATDTTVSLLAAAPAVMTVGMFNSGQTTDQTISQILLRKVSDAPR